MLESMKRRRQEERERILRERGEREAQIADRERDREEQEQREYEDRQQRTRAAPSNEPWVRVAAALGLLIVSGFAVMVVTVLLAGEQATNLDITAMGVVATAAGVWAHLLMQAYRGR